MHRVEINCEVFLKILNHKTCLVQEIRSKFLGIQTSLKDMALSGKLKQVPESESEGENNDDR